MNGEGIRSGKPHSEEGEESVSGQTCQGNEGNGAEGTEACHSGCHVDQLSEEAERKSHHSENFKNGIIVRLNRIEGQVRGVKAMVDKDVYCDDVLNQIASIQSALNGVGKLLLEGHLKSCVTERIRSGDNGVIEELMTTMKKLLK